MDLTELARSAGEWLRGTGPESDIVISTRLRLARNLADYPFSNRTSPREKTEIARIIRRGLEQTAATSSFEYLNVDELDELDRQLLVERQLISREHAMGEGERGAVFSPAETISIMINEEDHLRIQVLRSGLSLQQCWEEARSLDESLEEYLTFAFHPRFGYLTACPTNVGTGLRASVMLHLPALSLTKQLDRMFRALQKLNLAVRGLYGEGSQASGDFFQISNQVTLGRTEEQIIENIGSVVPDIVGYEREARRALVSETRSALEDRVARSLGLLRAARSISSEETMHHLSNVRMGINLGLIDDVEIVTVNELFIHTQPAHLQKIQGMELDSQDRNIVRADYLRRRLREPSNN